MRQHRRSFVRRVSARQSTGILKPAMTIIILIALTTNVLIGCRRYRSDLDYSHEVEQTWKLEDGGDEEFVQFASVFWEPDDTVSLRELIVEDQIADGREILEIGTGTGLLAVLSALHGAKKVVATLPGSGGVLGSPSEASARKIVRTIASQDLSAKIGSFLPAESSYK